MLYCLGKNANFRHFFPFFQENHEIPRIAKKGVKVASFFVHFFFQLNPKKMAKKMHFCRIIFYATLFRILSLFTVSLKRLNYFLCYIVRLNRKVHSFSFFFILFSFFFFRLILFSFQKEWISFLF